jgi:glycosyltransferase involved in cell wall biosynthesis
MACGTPVVASAAASLPEVVGAAALTVAPTDDDGLAAAIRRVLTDPVLAADLRLRGLARAACFSWTRTAAETARVYRQAAGEEAP